MTQSEQLPEDLENQDASEDEFAVLKTRAKLMGIPYSNNIKLETLRAKVNAKQAGEAIPKDDDEEDQGPSDDAIIASVNPLNAAGPAAEAPPVRQLSLREYMVKTQMKLVRLRIQNLDPKKKDLPGEIFCVANESLGTVKKYIPYGEASDEGYHVPFCIYTELETRRFLNIRTYKDKVTHQIRIDTSWAREFSIEVLEPLTREEINMLAAAQAAAGNK